LVAVERLVRRLLAGDVGRAGARGYLEKILVFTTFVGSEVIDQSGERKDYGTASSLKKRLERVAEQVIRRPPKKLQRRIRDSLWEALAAEGEVLESGERARVKALLARFSGTRAAGLLLGKGDAVKAEATHLKTLLRAVPPPLVSDEAASDEEDAAEAAERRQARRQEQLSRLLDRYRSRDLVARYDGAVSQEQRDSHLRGFNSPFSPLVVIASSVGQEGIDLQRYCRSVVHYDLEWNPARIEQREGRVDRHGRLAKGPIDVYMMVCKDTYDERILHAMINRSRWHRVLLARRRTLLEGDPSAETERSITSSELARVELDLRPARTGS
jgi:hypothetical protein